MKTLIIAEAGVNHNGSLDRAIELVDRAAEAGADIVKFQTWSTDLVAQPATPMVEYQKKGGVGTDLYDLGKKLELANEDFVSLKRHCDDAGIGFLSTPFDIPSIHFLAKEIGVSHIKIPSGEAVNVPLLRAAAETGLPIILSTGMCALDEVRFAVETVIRVWEVRGIIDPGLTLLHCTTAYPTPLAEAHLRSMTTLKEKFNRPVGFSDHTEGIVAAIAAAAMGACVIEKHFTLDRTMPGPDHAASIEPDGLKSLIRGVRDVEMALGSPEKALRSCEADTVKIVRRALVATCDIPLGATITESMLIALRPENGIPARDLDKVVGQRAWRSFTKGEPLQWPG